MHSEAARGAEFWMLEYMGELELMLGYLSQDTCAELRKILERAASEATRIEDAAGNAAE